MKKNSRILIGTHNKGKFKEISYLLPKNFIKISPLQFNINSPKETGKTFIQNADLKASYFFKKTKLTCISDDSGLSIKALKGQPGIHSARFAKKNGGFFKAMKIILKRLRNHNDRRATFTCALSLKTNKKKKFNVLGKVEGKISFKILGKNGFGYDPIFIPNGKTITFGQMAKKKKMKTDHRFIAFNKLRKKISTL